ncbi:hypothetical protein [Armatimonas rosea]|uniref:Outer membrane lipoprotein-sorting protein n=1 Tax=Armatimonas rosea TaxID=685828 RepID=A0A7W9SVM8_ARMRO|nr:hypothetical protein [Armatimonas rosea]MBB6053526.1 hypothetical protein [Armatimonas rosea]
MSLVVAVCAMALVAQAPEISLKESAAPDSVMKLTPTGAKSLRFAQVNYGVSGGKLLLHEYRVGDPGSAVRYLDILTPSGKRLQKFQLGYAPETVSRDYKIRPLWVIPARKKLPALHFEGLGAHLFVVFPKGFAQPGSQQFLSELDGDKKRLISFDELDRRGYRMIRIDVDEPAVEGKPAYKGTTYYFWSGTKFEEKKR